MLEYIIVFFCAIFIGTITGLIPGLHINLVSSILVSAPILALLNLSPASIMIFIVSMSVTHTFLDLIPGIFLGSPNDDSFLSILPGHYFLKRGLGFYAAVLSLRGALIGVVATIILAPLTIIVIPRIYSYLSSVMFLILISASLYLILTQKNRILALLVFLLSGILGLATLNLPLDQSLLPLLSGLFGGSSLIFSLFDKTKIPHQRFVSEINKFDFKQSWGIFKSLLLSAPLPSFLPGLGSSQAAIIGSSFINNNRKDFLMLIGGINVTVLNLSFVAAYSISKARTGASAAILNVLGSFTLSQLIIALFVSVLSSIIAYNIGIFVSRRISKIISKINYFFVSITVLLVVVLIVIIFSGWLGFLLFFTSAFLGLFTLSLGVRRTNLMGSLLLPTIFLYLPF